MALDLLPPMKSATLAAVPSPACSPTSEAVSLSGDAIVTPPPRGWAFDLPFGSVPGVQVPEVTPPDPEDL